VPTAVGLRASPAARKLAADRGIDLTALVGTGPGGAVVVEDVERAAQAPPPKPAPPPEAVTLPPPEPAAARRGFDASEMRKAIAAAMSRSKREIPHYYLAHTLDFTPAAEWLRQLNGERAPPERVLPAALLLKSVALALKAYPEFNGFHPPEGFHPSAAIHVGAAIAIRGGGLVAPAIHDADGLTLDGMMAALRDLVARTRSGRLRSSEMFDPTITVSSLGERGVDCMFAVIYPPQVAIVGFGTPALRPWVRETKVEPRTVVTATLAADHRVSDGHRGALLLLEIERLLQHPEAL
jgi:pyruvate dehydrogenase E2 component (dihydrolipoamide acetyltransferase)